MPQSLISTSMSWSVKARGTSELGLCAIALGATISHSSPWSTPLNEVSGERPSQGKEFRAFLPECPNWMPTRAPWALTNSVILFSGAMKSSFQMPRSRGVPQPRACTFVDSRNTRPAPPVAKRPRFTRCQSDTNPLTPAYINMGETTILLRKVTSRIWRVENRNEFIRFS